MTKRSKAPWRKVFEATLEEASGRSIFPPYIPLGNQWTLKLECGHIAHRDVRYIPIEEGRRGGSLGRGKGWFYRRSSDDALPAPKKVACEWCAMQKPLDKIDQKAFMDTAIGLLDQKASKPEGAYWLVGEDESESYCYDCVHILKPQAVPGDDYRGGGSYEEDSSTICARCGKLLDYILTDDGVESELAHFTEHKFDWNSADECFALARAAYGIYKNEAQTQRLFQILATAFSQPLEIRKILLYDK